MLCNVARSAWPALMVKRVSDACRTSYRKERVVDGEARIDGLVTPLADSRAGCTLRTYAFKHTLLGQHYASLKAGQQSQR